MTRARVLVVACLAATLLADCGGDARRPCVLLVTIDTLRADAVSPDAGPEATPSLSALAARGTRFTAVTSVTPLTLPAHASLLTGLRPARHGLTVNGVTAAPFAVPTLAEHLAGAGYATAAFVSCAILEHEHGLDAGFDVYDDDLYVPGGPTAPKERRGDRTIDAASAWLDTASSSDAPWFVWTHLYDPHAPYAAPGGPEGQDRAAYQAEVGYADTQLGRLIEAATRAARGPLLVLVTSDHGEALGEHGEDTHGVLLHQATLHVPLVVGWEGTPPQDAPFSSQGVVRDDVVSLLDVTPTLLATLDLPVPDGLDGRAVIEPAPPRALPLESAAPWFFYGFSPLAGVRAGVLELVGAPRADPCDWQLFDLSLDPYELSPAAGDEHPLRAAVPSTEAEPPTRASGDAQALAELGYVGGGGARPEPDAPCRDPRRATGFVRALDAANTALVEGDPRAAYDDLVGLRDAWGDVPELRLFLGKALRGLGRQPEADAELSVAHALNPLSTDILLEWGKVLLEWGATSPDAATRAKDVFDRALALQPDLPEAIALRALHDVVFGDPAAAWARVEPALVGRPRHTALVVVGARALRALGRDDEARALQARLVPGG
ncbi:MAG: sulfatase-like hydrolase/transferase [Planctomycetes bacterium]|nr:sulfatase-like hydrolase/transferase [Planctomycetota bacterium]